MIKLTNYSIFESKHKNYLIPINCVGKIDSFILKDVIARYPEIEEYYQNHCQNGVFCLGKVDIFKIKDANIIFLPIRYYNNKKPKLEDIKEALLDLKNYKIKNINVPLYGYGNDILLEKIKELIISLFQDDEINLLLSIKPIKVGPIEQGMIDDIKNFMYGNLLRTFHLNYTLTKKLYNHKNEYYSLYDIYNLPGFGFVNYKQIMYALINHKYH